MTSITRDFTVAVFVVFNDQLILHVHSKLDRWLPPGGHIEPDELPDEAAIREVFEETGLAIELVGERGLPVDYPGQPRQLVRPEGIQVESIGPGHEHVDLIYFARPRRPTPNGDSPTLNPGMTWVSASELATLELSEEMRDWAALAFSALGDR